MLPLDVQYTEEVSYGMELDPNPQIWKCVKHDASVKDAAPAAVG